MAEEDNPDQTLEGEAEVAQASDPIDAGAAVTSLINLGSDDQVRLERALQSASQANRNMELYSKRLAGGAAFVVFLCAVLLLVAGGRLAGQVDALQAATLSMTKRIVNMNSALERMVILEQKLGTLDEGHAELVTAIGQLDEDGKTLALAIESSMTGVQTTIDDASEVTRSGAESTRFMAATLEGQSEKLDALARRVSGLEGDLGDVRALRSEVTTLVQIERDNLTELFEAQLALEQAQLSQSGDVPVVLEPEPVYPDDAIVFPPPAKRR
ncbi:MAG: hypothetical protein P8M73_10075 [Luminiphilus sp.]|nr:hypothetical protein [Luminiphilus sp.]